MNFATSNNQIGIGASVGNNKKKALLAMSESYGVVSRLVPGLGVRDFYLSYAKQVPILDDYSSVAYWMAGGHAARMRRVGLAPYLVAPGQNWFSGVDRSLTGRDTITAPLLELENLHLSDSTEIFFKPAEAKIECFKARIYAVSEVFEISRSNNIPSETLFQWTTDILPLNHEHRFFVANNEVMAGSPYLVDGIIYHSEMVSEYTSDAFKIAESFVKELGNNQPPAYSLDIALREDTKEWVIVEVNPAWSSGLYGCDPTSVIEVLDVASNAGSSGRFKNWLWEPAQYLVDLAENADPLEVLEFSEAPGVFALNSDS